MNIPHVESYTHGLIPGPTKVLPEVLEIYRKDYVTAEDAFFDAYDLTVQRVSQFLQTKADIVLMSGEGMVCLWGALKSVLQAGDVVLVIDAGVFGQGFGEMAEAIGCHVEYCKFPWNRGLTTQDLETIRQKVETLKPKLVTTVHCDTPTGWINQSVKEIGQICASHSTLFYVDFVSSFGGMEVLIDEWNVDLGLFGSQKCLNCMPDFGFISVSQKAWDVIDKVKYPGYDALLPFRDFRKNKEFVYTPHIRAILALNVALHKIEEEGKENVFNRHKESQAYTLQRMEELGLERYVTDLEWCSPTVTAILVPKQFEWETIERQMKSKGIAISGTFGDVKGQIFRIGHMGIQADIPSIKFAFDQLKEILNK